MTDLMDASTPQPITTKDHLLQRLKEGFHQHQQGEMEAAKACYQEVLEIQPDQFDALQLMGVLLAQSGEPSRAIDYFQKALELDPLNMSLNANCARAYMDLGYWSDALALYAAMIESAPHLSDGHKGWAECQIHLGGVEDAIAGFKSAIDLRDDDHEAYASLSSIYYNAKDYGQGIAYLDRAIEIAPNEANYHANRGLLLSKLNRSDEALEAVDRALQIDPQHVKAWITKGCLEIDFYRTEDALRSFDEALKIEPKDIEAIDYKASFLYTIGRLEDAIKTANLGFHNTRDMKYKSMALFISGHLLGIDEKKHFDKHCQFENELMTGRPHETSLPHVSALKRRIKIGFISSDFMWHVVSDLVGPVISSINHEEFEVFAYYNNDVEDVMTSHLKSKVDAWRQVEKLTDDDFSALIKKDEIDILIDLSGHTGRNRLPVFARKPAPIQVTWIGDPNTTGLSTVDYVLTDTHLSPYGLYEHYWTEHFVRIPAAATLDWVGASDYTSLELPALERGYVTFASFNRPSKLNDEVIKAWSTILSTVPNAKLLLGATPDCMHEDLLNWFSSSGVESQRLIFKPHLGRFDYIKQFSEIDILLDSWPYTGGGSTAVALAYGAVPIVTMAGNSMRHMQGAWLMQHLKLTDWVAHSVDEFIEIATHKAMDLDALARLRKELPVRWRSSALGNPLEVTKHIEKALSTMWQRYCLGKKPESFDIATPHTDANG